MKLSIQGALEIAEMEGIVPAPYLDSVSVWTYGIGHTAYAGDPNPEKMPRAMPDDLDKAIEDALVVFTDDIETYSDRVAKRVTVPLEQHEFDALVSFDFNTGGVWYRSKKTGRMTSAVAIQKINAGDKAGGAAALMNWVKPASLRTRRLAEKHLFLTGDYAANGDQIPIWRTDGQGNLKGVLRSISGTELLAKIQEPPEPVVPAPDMPPKAPPGTEAWLRDMADWVEATR